MQVTVNGEVVEIPDGTTISRLVEIAEVPANYLAVEINADVIPRDQHDQHLLVEGDVVEVVTLVGGG